MGVDGVGISVQDPGDLRGGVSFIIMKVNDLPVGPGQCPHRLHHRQPIRRHAGQVVGQLGQGDGFASEEAFEQILAGVHRYPDEPGFFVFGAVEALLPEGVFEENGLENIFRVGVVFQVDTAQPQDHVGICFNGSVYLLFRSHSPSFPRIVPYNDNTIQNAESIQDSA